MEAFPDIRCKKRDFATARIAKAGGPVLKPLTLPRTTSSCNQFKLTAGQTKLTKHTVPFKETAPLQSNHERTIENLGSLEENASVIKDISVNRNLKPQRI